ncbi:hypothetical protein [Halovivax gelatinilyticus]|uniref:hypothetical protein n=1 Tax=Halovivax gelatinilyticus TaxID=2961597 RepID=UPI0020CA76AB|nr:hypothetical protein [Halovivax gelatinilyticus]
MDDSAENSIKMQMSSEEFQSIVERAVKNAILGVLTIVLGIILALVFIVSGARMIVYTPGIVWNIFGFLNILFGALIFWWAVILQ